MGIGSYRHRVTLEQPGTPIPDGNGGYTETWATLTPPTWDASIQPATARDLEAVGAGTILASASHLIRGRYRPDVTTKTRVRFEGRTLNVVGLSNRDERDLETILICAETVN